jgi:hypothetical protein
MRGGENELNDVPSSARVFGGYGRMACSSGDHQKPLSAMFRKTPLPHGPQVVDLARPDSRDFRVPKSDVHEPAGSNQRPLLAKRKLTIPIERDRLPSRCVFLAFRGSPVVTKYDGYDCDVHQNVHQPPPSHFGPQAAVLSGLSRAYGRFWRTHRESVETGS